MAMVIASSVANVTEVQSNNNLNKQSNNDLNKQEHLIINDELDISKSVAECAKDKETHEKTEENVEKDSREIICNDMLSSTENTCHEYEKLQSKEVSDSSVENNCLEDAIDLDKISRENKVIANNELDFNGDNDSNVVKNILSKKLLDLVDSDSEQEINSYETSNKESSAADCSGSPQYLQIASSKGNLENKSIRKIIDSESEDDTSSQTNDFLQTVPKVVDTATNGYQTLIDSESEEDTIHNSSITCDNVNTYKNKDIKEKSFKKRKGSIRASKDEAMHKIHSETQRLLRETEISLPYHRPKQRTLQEFLNRNKLLAALPKAPSAAAKLKMSSIIVSQALAEKEKEAELFYKSSDSEDDTLQSTFSTCKNKNCSTINEKMPSMDLQDICIQDAQKNETNNQDSHNEKEIIQQDKQVSSLTENSSNQDGESESEKYKRGFQKTNVVKKLFDTNSQNEVDGVSDINYTQQETADIFLDKEKCVNNEKESSMIENHILQISKVQRDSEMNESNGNESKLQDNLLTEKYKKFDSHILGLPLPNFTDESLTDRNKLPPKLTSNSKVTLKGSPGMIIDLTDNAKSSEKGVNTLLDRFFCKHVNTKKQANNKSEVTVIHVQDTQNGPIPIKETLPYKLPINTDNSELNKPGAKLLRLKEDLKLQMTLKRNEEWKQKEIELQTQEKELNREEESDCDLDGQERIDNLELSDSGESEPEENDVCIKDKKRRKCLFADDEAEVTDDESSDISTEQIYNESDIDEVEHSSKRLINFKHENKSKKEDVDDNASEIEIDQEEDEDLDADVETGSETNFKDAVNEVDNIYKDIIRNEKDRKTKQLIQEFQDDSYIINSKDLENKNNQSKNIVAYVDKIPREDNNWINEDENDTSAFQQHTEVTTKSQMCKTPLKAKTSMLDFVSPVTQLSVLNITLDSSNIKDVSENREFLVDEQEFTSIGSTQNSLLNKSPEHAYRNKTVSPKKLFDDIEETVDDEYLKQLCSGKFGSTQKTDFNLKDLSSQANISESQLLKLCSGNFNMQSIDTKQLEEMENEISQDIRLTLNEDLSDNSVNINQAKKISVSTDSKKFIKIAFSGDESQSDEEDTFFRPKNRPVKRLNLSDSEEENTESSDEENDDKEAEEYIDYDSEENEVVVAPKKDMKEIVAGFLEEEAELSESDWDSVDEDEKGLDKLEFEEADNEHLDEDEVKNQLEKIHMRQILDEDKREVRMLKELLFEDGDLHMDGAGRERKFKWKNIDKLGNNIEMPQVLDENDGWVDVQEDEEEAKWSKLRHERDKFLEERMKSSSNEIEDELNDSQIFKHGLEALKKIKSNESQKQDSHLDKIDSSENMEPIMPRNLTDLLNAPNIGKKSQTIYNFIKRRSLLTRGEESLARIASFAKQGDPVSHTTNTRNFVFQYIDPHTDNNPSKEERGESIESSEEGLLNLQNKSRKRKVTSEFLQRATRKRRK